MIALLGRRVAAVLLAAAAGACAELQPVWTDPGWDVESVARLPSPDDPMLAELRDGYVALAAAERAEADWRDAAAFLRKARSAADGATPAPSTLADRTVASEALRIALAAAEPELLALLGSRGARLRAPRELARMQLDWECWIQEAEEGHQFAEIEACGAAFDRSLAAAREAAALPKQLVVVLPEAGGEIGGVVLTTAGGAEIVLDTPFAAGSGGGAVGVAEDEVREVFGRALDARPQPPSFFTLYFDFGSSRLDAEAEALVARIAADALGRPSPEVLVLGHADAFGGAEANRRLSRSRALAVRDAIAAAIGPEQRVRISASFRGEAEPATPNPGPEPLNRRVGVTVR